jgi:hypothetical protein
MCVYPLVGTMMFDLESIITVSLNPYAWMTMAKCQPQPQSIKEEVIPLPALPSHLRSHHRHHSPLK